MLKDHVDLDALSKRIAAYVRGEGPKPADVATWRLACVGETCDGCGKQLVAGKPYQWAFADESYGHAHCHAGSPPVLAVTRRRYRR